MRLVRFVFPFLLVLAIAFAAPAELQHNENSEDPSGSSIAVALYSTTTAGSLVVVGVWVNYNDPEISCGDTQSGTYTALPSAGPVWEATYGSALQFFYRANIGASSGFTVTCSFSGSYQYRRINVHEFSGVATSNPLDQWSQKGTSTATTSTDGAPLTEMTTTVNGDLIIGLMGQMSPWAATVSAGTGYTLTGTYLEWKVQSTAGAVTPAFTFSSGDYYHGIAAAFKPAGASARRRQVVIE